MYSQNRGDTILPVKSDTGFGPVYWVASSKSRKTFYVKLANYGAAEQPVTVKIPAAVCRGASGKAQLTVLSGPEYGTNYPGNVTILPQNAPVTGNHKAGYSFALPGWGVAVLKVT